MLSSPPPPSPPSPPPSPPPSLPPPPSPPSPPSPPPLQPMSLIVNVNGRQYYAVEASPLNHLDHAVAACSSYYEGKPLGVFSGSDSITCGGKITIISFTGNNTVGCAENLDPDRGCGMWLEQSALIGTEIFFIANAAEGEGSGGTCGQNGKTFTRQSDISGKKIMCATDNWGDNGGRSGR